MTPGEQVIAPPASRRGAERPPESGDGLVRGLTLPMATAIVVGTMIGTGIFIKPAEIARLAGSVEWALAAWVAGGVLTLLAALCYMELGTMMPAAGADYAYLKRAWNPGVGFVFGWKQFVVTHPASMASLASGSALFASFIWPGLRTPVAQMGSVTIEAGNLFAAALIVAVTLINLLDVAAVGRFQVVLTSLKVISLLAVVGIGLVFAGRAAPDLPAASTRGVSLTGFAAAIAASLWTFSGWHTMLRVGSEIQQPERTIPRAMLAGFGTTAVLFLLINIACFQVLGFDAVAASPHVTSDLLQVTIGVAGAGLLSLMMLLSAVGSLNTTTLGTARISYAMARDRLLPGLLARVDPVRRVPTWSVIAPSVVAIAFVLTGSFEDLTSLFVFTQWLFYALGIWGLMRLRRIEPEAPRPVRVPFYPVLPVLVIVLSLVLTAFQFTERPLRSSIGLALVLLGWPVYLWMRGRAAQSVPLP